MNKDAYMRLASNLITKVQFVLKKNCHLLFKIFIILTESVNKIILHKLPYQRIFLVKLIKAFEFQGQAGLSNNCRPISCLVKQCYKPQASHFIISTDDASGFHPNRGRNLREMCKE